MEHATNKYTVHWKFKQTAEEEQMFGLPGGELIFDFCAACTQRFVEHYTNNGNFIDIKIEQAVREDGCEVFRPPEKEGEHMSAKYIDVKSKVQEGQFAYGKIENVDEYIVAFDMQGLERALGYAFGEEDYRQIIRDLEIPIANLVGHPFEPMYGDSIVLHPKRLLNYITSMEVK